MNVGTGFEVPEENITHIIVYVCIYIYAYIICPNSYSRIMNLWMNGIYIFKEISRAINIRHATASSRSELISVSWEV